MAIAALALSLISLVLGLYTIYRNFNKNDDSSMKSGLMGNKY